MTIARPFLYKKETRDLSITSASNMQIKKVQQILKKARTRREEGVFAAEGAKMFREAPKDRLRKIFVSQAFALSREGKELLAEKGLDTESSPLVEIVEDRIFKSLSDTITSREILFLVEIKTSGLEEMTEGGKPPLLMILEDLQDPGNLGTIVRTGEGAGVTGVILSKNSVDIYNPKVIRSTMGSIYRMPVLYTDSIEEEILPVLKEKGIHTLCSTSSGKKFLRPGGLQRGNSFLYRKRRERSEPGAYGQSRCAD